VRPGALSVPAQRAQQAGHFKAGNPESRLGGLAKAGKLPVESKCSPPAKRDIKAKDARSTVGVLAAEAKVSLRTDSICSRPPPDLRRRTADAEERGDRSRA
jgi:hypothetical protein